MRRVLTLILLLFGLSDLSGQVQERNWSAVAGVGGMNYFGDLSWHFTNLKETRLGYSGGIERYITPGFGLRLQYIGGTITANDRASFILRDNNVTSNDQFARSLNFETRLHNLNLLFVFHLDNGKIMKTDAVVSPFFSVGGGIGWFRVKGDLLTESGGRYYYWSDQTIRDIAEDAPDADKAVIIEQDGVFETTLSDLDIEKNYKPFSFHVPVGVGLKFRINASFDIRLESQFTYTFTDYLDDVGGKPVGTYDDDFIAYAADPAGTINGNRGNMRNGLHDTYLYTSLSLSYNFGRPKVRYDGMKIRPIDLVQMSAVPFSTDTLKDPSSTDTVMKNTEIAPVEAEADTVEKETIREETVREESETPDTDSGSKELLYNPKYVVHAETAIFEPTIVYVRDATTTVQDQTPDTIVLAKDSVPSIALDSTLKVKDTTVVSEIEIDSTLELTDTAVVPDIDSASIFIDSVETIIEDSVVTPVADSLTLDTLTTPTADSSLYLTGDSSEDVVDTLSVLPPEALDSLTIEPDADTLLMDTVLMQEEDRVLQIDTTAEAGERDTTLLEFTARIDELKQMVSQLQTDLSSVQEGLVAVNATLKERDTLRVTVLTDTVTKEEFVSIETTIMDELRFIREQVSRLEARLMVEDTITADSLEMRAIPEDDTTGVQQQLGDIYSELSIIRASIATLGATERARADTTIRITSEDGRIDSVLQQQARYHSDMTDRLDSLTVKVTGYDTYMTGLEDDIGDLERLIEGLDSSAMAGLDDHMNTLTESVDQLNQSYTSTLEQILEKLNQPVSEADSVSASASDDVDLSVQVNTVDSTTLVADESPDEELSDSLKTEELIRTIIERLEPVADTTEVDTTSIEQPAPVKNDTSKEIKVLNETLQQLSANYDALIRRLDSMMTIRPVTVEQIEPEAEPVSPKATYPTTRVFFKVNQTSVDPSYYSKLESVAQFSATHPSAILEIKGFADPSGNATYNLSLSGKRAESVRSFLVMQLDVDPSRVRVLPMGEETISGQSPEFSRRVEIIVR